MRKTTGAPILPAKLYADLLFQTNKTFADEILDDVQNGVRTIESVEKMVYKKGRDIDPEDWQDFEDGWRPED